MTSKDQSQSMTLEDLSGPWLISILPAKQLSSQTCQEAFGESAGLVRDFFVPVPLHRDL